MASINKANSSIKHQGSVITIGTFDGVHIGHQKILERLVSVAKNKDLEPKILTFFPHPRMVLQKGPEIKLLNTIEEKKALIKSLGINQLVIRPFTKDFANLPAEDYVKTILVEELKAKHIIIGYDHRFGRNRGADINDLKGYGEKYNFTVEEIPAQDIKDIAVSSTKIRHALTDGNLQLANSYLGYPYFITGAIVKGKGLGRTIDFPTANLSIDKTYKLIPKHGAYVVVSTINNKKVYGMMNIGINPTVDGSKESIEVHFFEFNEDLYGDALKIELLSRLRDEQKFESIEALKLQLQKDKENAFSIIKGLE